MRFIQRHIKELQKADEGTKKFWLVIFSGISMTIIVTLWMVYLNATLPIISKTGDKEQETPNRFTTGQARNNEQTAWGTFRKGWQEIKSDFDEKFNTIKQMTAESMEMIKRQQTTQIIRTDAKNTNTNEQPTRTTNGNQESGIINQETENQSDKMKTNINNTNDNYEPLELEPVPAVELP